MSSFIDNLRKYLAGPSQPRWTTSENPTVLSPPDSGLLEKYHNEASKMYESFEDTITDMLDNWNAEELVPSENDDLVTSQYLDEMFGKDFMAGLKVFSNMHGSRPRHFKLQPDGESFLMQEIRKGRKWIVLPVLPIRRTYSYHGARAIIDGKFLPDSDSSALTSAERMFYTVIFYLGFQLLEYHGSMVLILDPKEFAKRCNFCKKLHHHHLLDFVCGKLRLRYQQPLLIE